MLAYPFKKVEDLRPFLRPFFTEHHLQMLLKCKTLLLYVSCVYLKVRLSTSKKKCFICFNGSPLKMMKNAIYFILKAFSFSRYLIFCLDFLFMYMERHFGQKLRFVFMLNSRDFPVERSRFSC